MLAEQVCPKACADALQKSTAGAAVASATRVRTRIIRIAKGTYQCRYPEVRSCFVLFVARPFRTSHSVSFHPNSTEGIAYRFIRIRQIVRKPRKRGLSELDEKAFKEAVCSCFCFVCSAAFQNFLRTSVAFHLNFDRRHRQKAKKAWPFRTSTRRHSRKRGVAFQTCDETAFRKPRSGHR